MDILVLKKDITKLKVDAIVNAAKNSLLGGGGVDGAIHKAGGPEILEECKKIGGCKTGEAVFTTAGNMDAKYVIHTVGPVYRVCEKKEAKELLYNSYKNSLILAEELNCNSIAFPNISTGVYAYPLNEAVDVVKELMDEYMKKGKLKEVIFCCFDEENHKLYQEKFGL